MLEKWIERILGPNLGPALLLILFTIGSAAAFLYIMTNMTGR